ncbi:MAG: hypothetical protein ABSF61_13620 [Anaerolineales bacterium]|jgi:hypothetical protein
MSPLPRISSRAIYRIRIAGRVGNGWDDFMTDLREAAEMHGDEMVTVLTGAVADQAALFGLLCRVRDLGFVLVSAEYLSALE